MHIESIETGSAMATNLYGIFSAVEWLENLNVWKKIIEIKEMNEIILREKNKNF